MPNDKKSPVGSSFPISLMSTEHAKTSRMSGEKVYEGLDAALEVGDYPRALELLDGAPHWMKRQPEIMLIRASVLMSLDNDRESLHLMQEIERKHPQFTSICLPLSMFYMDQEWPAHALQAARRALTDHNLDKEDRATVDELIEDATTLIKEHAAESGLTHETMRRTFLFHEKALMAMDDNKLSEGERLSKEAIKIAPNWSPPHITRADALFFLGKTSEAIAVSEAVLAREAKNVFALRNLVTYHLGLDQPEKAQEYATRLREQSASYSPDGIEIEEIITGLALVEDTPALLKIVKRYLGEPSEALFARSWECLAVAAIRSGQWKDGLQLMEKAEKEEQTAFGKILAGKLKDAAGLRLPRLEWMPPAYPVIDQFLHPKVMAEWSALVKLFNDPLSPSQKRKQDVFFHKYPFMVVGMKRLLWDKDTHDIALAVLGALDTADTDAEIIRFALSDTANWGTRLNALLSLTQIGRYSGPKIVKMWHENLQEWHDEELNTQRIGNTEINAQPQTLVLIDKAINSKNLQEGIALLRKAVEMEPTCAEAVLNLGVLLTRDGKIEEGETLFRRSVEVDPDFMYGHASLALKEAVGGNKQEAFDHLDVISQADIISPGTAVVVNLAWTSLSLQMNDLKSARQRFDMAARINPDHFLLEPFEKMLKEVEDSEKYFDFLREEALINNQRARQKLLKTPLTAEMGLHACLETKTKNMLTNSAYFLRTSASGKKAELVSRLAEILLDTKLLHLTLDDDLNKKERSALRWLLKTGGVRPWKEFVRKYGFGEEEYGDWDDWDDYDPENPPSRLTLSGLLFTGTLDGQEVAFIPADMRPLLLELLK